ncbi:class I SAM-dependent methyltransferase, partial [Klebsiella pneumoniae]|uniref:class I SAM-dependent methyltransferase n=2 Tax=Bacteria TaxID=2 RepID=UPI001F117660
MVGADPTIMSALLSTPLTTLIRPASHPMTVGDIIDAIADFPIRVTAFDGSSAGVTNNGAHGAAPSEMGIHITKDGLAYIATAPGELGLARAYLTNNLRVSGTHPANPYDLFGVLRTVRLKKLSPSTIRRIIGSLAALDAFRNLPQPPQEMVPFWQRAIDGLSRHSQQRDAESISHHYDVSNRFYELFLGPSMTYTCAYY